MMVTFFKFRDGRAKANEESMTTPFLFYWVYHTVYNGVKIRSPITRINFLDFRRTRPVQRFLKDYKRIFFNELVYASDVLIEFSDLSACFWDMSFVKKRYTIITFEELRRKDFEIMSIPSRFRQFKHQQVIYELWKRGTKLYPGAQILTSKPPSVIIKLDQTYNRVRLEGPNTIYPAGFGRWARFSRSAVTKQ